MANDVTRRRPGLGAGFLVIGAVVIAAGTAVGAGNGNPAKGLDRPAVRGTCTPAPAATSAATSTCFVSPPASSALPEEAASTERALPAPPIAKCEDVPPSLPPLDEPRMTEC